MTLLTSFTGMTSIRLSILFVATLFGTIVAWGFFDSLIRNVLSPLILSGMPLNVKRHELPNGHTIQTGEFVSAVIVYAILLIFTMGIVWLTRRD